MSTTKMATYVGRRITTEKKLGYFWIWAGEDDKLLGYVKQLAPATIGETWVFTCAEKGGFWMTGKDKPVPVPGFAEPDKVLAWTAEDTACVQRDQETKANRNLAKRKTQFDQAIAPLEQMCASLKHHEARAAFIAAVTSRLWRRT